MDATVVDPASARKLFDLSIRLFMTNQSKCALVRSSLVAAALLAVSLSCFSQQEISRSQQADAAYRAGQAAFAHQDFEVAERDFEKAVRLAPAMEQGHGALGAVLLRLGRYNDAVRELETAFAMLKTDSIAQTNLALAYLQAGEPTKAVSQFAALEAQAKIQKRTLPSYVLSNYAHALVATGNLDQAAAKMKTAIFVAPREAALHDDLGSIYAQQKQWSSARQEFAAAVHINPSLANAHLHLGLAMQALGQPDGLKELARGSQLAPENNAVAFEYAKALTNSGQDDAAIPVLQGILSRNPNAIDAIYELALALQRSNRASESVDLFNRVIVVQPENAPAMTNLGMALAQMQRAKDAVPVLQRAVALAPDSVIAHQDLAAAFVQLNQFSDAVTELRAALKLAPDLPQLHYNLGLAFKMQDDPSNAVPELETAEKLDPHQPEAPLVLGLLYMQTGRYEDAARELKTSLTLCPQNGDGWATLGSVYNKLDRLPEATEALQEAIQQLPHSPDPRLTLAGVMVKQNKPSEAAELRKQAADLMRTNMNSQRAEVATNAGNSLLKNGDLAGAATQFQEALSYDSKYSGAHEGLARVYDAKGDKIAAAAERQKAILKP